MKQKIDRKRIAVFLLLLALVGLLVLMPILLRVIQPRENLPETDKKPPVVIADSEWKNILALAAGPVRGNPKTPYTMVEFGDFQCEPCLGARPKLEGTLKLYPTKVNLLFVNRPLPKSHAWAIPAAEFAQMASYYGKFWDAYDFLYDHQKDLEPGFYPDYAVKVGMTAAQYGDPDKRKEAEIAVAQARDYSNKIGLKTTPSLVVRDNATGILTVVVGGDDLDAFMKTAPWTPSSPSSPAKGFPFSVTPGSGSIAPK